MQNRNTISVWLILEDGENKSKVVLQKRAANSQSFPFVCQATWAGKVEQGETLEGAMKRECQEELGEEFKNKFDFSRLDLISKESFQLEGEDWESYNYKAEVKEENLGFAKMHQDAFAEFVLISGDGEVYSLESGKSPEQNIVLFNDQYKAFKKIF